MTTGARNLRGIADRARRARGRSVCGACREPVTPGQEIVRVADTRRWVHARCARRMLDRTFDHDGEDSL